eukprot:CAMPEP_0114238274 /NCGR_PEP_ID=MMETSP0058-20121206/7838_1 /TAXON_ID=36894 /ORGANISM="Pyramimonas parkeae, CCMP726" /LENGTH=157 /DNA_ID=CAMNT_0001350375 /DNA_START=104 /DNA_END=577 /DNA_ORIENTATION=-
MTLQAPISMRNYRAAGITGQSCHQRSPSKSLPRSYQRSTRNKPFGKYVVRAMAEESSKDEDPREKQKEQERLEMLNKPVFPPDRQGRFGKIRKDGPDDFGAAGSTRGGEFGLGPAADRALNAWGDANGMLIAGTAVLVLFAVLVYIGPPPPSPSSLY